MTRDKLMELATRAEAAGGVDRELDLDIQRAVRKCQPESLHLETALGRGHAFHDSSAHQTGYCLGGLPHFTASLDAVMSLIPEGSQLTLKNIDPDEWYAIIATAHDSFGGAANTPALALLAACLRAIAEDETK